MSREVEEIKAKLDLVDFMSEYVKLLPAGGNFKALCPFHNEKTPSLMVNRQRQIWKCFGCGEGGDVFNFLMKIEGLEFAEALKVLAQRAGVALRTQDPALNSEKNRLYGLLDLAARYWHKVLLDSSAAKEARDYLSQRGLSWETIEDFRLGYAIEAWDDLNNFLIKKGFTEAEIFSAGLSVKKERGTGFYDRFRARIMFPILDLHGRAVGFGGRTLKKEEAAKYINTPQTSVYNKSSVLYGFYRAKETIKKNDLCILVEGYMDVLPSYQAGVKNVAAISGTALTGEQIKILKRYSNNLALALDMDAAGQQAALRSIDLALAEEMNVKIISLPFGKDPGECIKNNPQDWPDSIVKAQAVMDYFFGSALSKYDISQPEQKKKAAKFLLEKISKLGDRVEQDYWLKKLAATLAASEAVLRELLVKLERGFGKRVGVKKTEAAQNRPSEDQELILLKRLLVLAFNFPQYFFRIVESVSLDFWNNDLNLSLYKKIVLFYTRNTGSLEKLSVDKLGTEIWKIFDEWLKRDKPDFSAAESKLLEEVFLLAQAERGVIEEKAAKEELDNFLKLLKNNYLTGEIDRLKQTLEKAELAGRPAEELAQIYLKLNELIKQKNIN
ncbi:MAG: DNA primase [Patescibacteria group bacterium]